MKWVWKERKRATEWYRSYPQEGAAKKIGLGLDKIRFIYLLENSEEGRLRTK